MPFYRNVSEHTRTWGRLTDKATGTTLELAPGESAEVDTPDGFADQHLVECAPPQLADVVAMHPAKGKQAKDNPQAAAPAIAPEEE